MCASTLALHPDNPHYFLFRGKPTVLITSGEHYASVLNLDFDYRQYLNTLHTEGLNHTRLFVGVYHELPDDFWPGNPLGTQPGRFVCPFGRSQVPGSADGGNKFDLDTWDDIFFKRLQDFCHIAEGYGIVIEINLFCPYYVTHAGTKYWDLSPWHPTNNLNDLGEIDPTSLFTLRHPLLLACQERMVRKIVREFNSYDNLFFEICNEPYFDVVTLEWQEHIAELIQAEEGVLPLQHLISRNVANVWAEEKEPHAALSILNFHYSKYDPSCVTTNYHLNRVIGCNETGFNGAVDEPYRIQAWQFMLSGGGLFNHLDSSFRAGDEAGSVAPPETDQFGGGPVLRRQMRILKDFIESFDLVCMSPANSLVAAQVGLETVSILANPGLQYGMYILGAEGQVEHALSVLVRAGQYAVEYVNVCNGEPVKSGIVMAAEGVMLLELPAFQRDIAVRINRLTN